MSLLNKKVFSTIFKPLQDKRIGFIQMDGNAGDNLIRAATLQLFKTFKIDVRQINDDELRNPSIINDFDEFVISGGANIGSLYPQCVEQRLTTLSHGLPVTIFPQSFTSEDEDITPYKQVYVREKTSLKINPSLILAPDLALGYEDINTVMPPEYDTGVFLRQDVERNVEDSQYSICDPASICWQPKDYLNLASQFAHIYTDRLHFAIAALITGRQVTLLPNTYYKNLAMYDTWLADLGCHWLNDLTDFVLKEPGYDRQTLVNNMELRLADVPEWGPAWSSVPSLAEGDQWTEKDGDLQLIDKIGTKRLNGDETMQMIWSLCDGERDIRAIATMFGDAYPEQRLQIARDVRNSIRSLYQSSAAIANRNEATDKMAIRLQQMDDFTRDGWHYRQARLIYPDIPEKCLWFSVPEEYASMLDKRFDSFVIASIMEAMHEGRPLHIIGGKVSSSLIGHLRIFAAVWGAWRKEYHEIRIESEIIDDKNYNPGDRALLAFSGGLDSAYSAWKLKDDPDIKKFSALMVHGLDIPLTDRSGFDKAFKRAKAMLDCINIDLIPMRTNFRAVHGDQHWEYRHATGIAGALALLQGHFSSGIISSTLPATMQSFWGSSPTTDPFLGSRSFPINHYGDEAARLAKFKAITDWPEGIQYLRVCWQGLERDRNCGHCTKCLMTRLSLLLLKQEQNCFEASLTADEIISLMPVSIKGKMAKYDLREVIVEARENFPGAPWVEEMNERYAYAFYPWNL